MKKKFLVFMVVMLVALFSFSMLALTACDDNDCPPCGGGNQIPPGGDDSDIETPFEPTYTELFIKGSRPGAWGCFVINIMEDGNAYYTFTPEYTSDYQIILNYNSNAILHTTDTEIIGEKKDGKTYFTVKILAKQEYKFVLFHNAEKIEFEYGIKVCPANDLSPINMDADENYLIKIENPNTQMKKILTSSPNVKIKSILTLGDNFKFEEHNAFYNYTPSNMINLMMVEGREYYLVLSSSIAQTASLMYDDAIPQIELNGGEVPLSLTAQGSYQYVEFNVTAYDKTYTFTTVAQGTSQAPASALFYKVYKADGDLYTGGYRVVSGAYNLPISNGKYYIGFQTLGVENVIIRVSKA